MPPVLSREEIVSIRVLAEHGVPNTEVARQLGVTEGAVRYHRRRQELGLEDGRRGKPFRASDLAEVIGHWFDERSDSKRPVNVLELFDHLVTDHGYEGSYKSVLRYVRRRFGRPAIRTLPGGRAGNLRRNGWRQRLGDPRLALLYVPGGIHAHRAAVRLGARVLEQRTGGLLRGRLGTQSTAAVHHRA